jgi:hypothetical protein
MRVHAAVIVHMAINADMLDRRIRMQMDDAGPVSCLGKAGSDGT